MDCTAHIIHNALQVAFDCLAVDIESMSTISKIYEHFHTYAVHVLTQNDFCDFVAVEYKNILGHTET